MTTDWRALFAGQPVARLATVRPDGAPHVVPVTFAVVGDVVATAVDHKPKRSRDLQRLRNIGAEPRVSLLADHYDDTWDRLWWVRADGTAVVADASSGAGERGLEALETRYPAYRSRPPAGPVILVTVERWTGWKA
jgi:PPOX class probable F420-dependent enzyme